MKRIPWFWWVRLTVTVAAVVVVDASWHHQFNFVKFAALIGVGIAACAGCDVMRWSYRQELKEKREHATSGNSVKD